eukprot:gene5700-9520_t
MTTPTPAVEGLAYQEQINEYDSDEETPDLSKTRYERVKYFIWNVLEQEKPTKFGAIVNIILMIIIILNLTLMTIETEPALSENENDFYFIFFHGLEIFFSLFFLWELFLRNWSASSAKKFTGGCFKKRLKYFFSFWNIIDVLSVMPSLVYIVLGFISVALPRQIVQTNFYFLKDAVFIFRTLRFLRVLRIHYFFNLFGILKKVLISKWKELLVSIFLMITVVLFFGLFIHIFERREDPQNFGSIPRSFYFVMITLSTIGYGDVVPKTVFGKLIVSVCALLPIGLFGVPLTVIASGLIEELQTDNKEIHDQLKRFLGKKSKKLVNTPTTTITSGSSVSLKPGRTSSDVGEFDDFLQEREMRNRSSMIIPNLKPNADIKNLLKLLNDDEENINFYDSKLLASMIDFGVSLNGIFIPYSHDELSFEMKKVKKLGGITSVKSLKKIIDGNEYKMKDIQRLIKSIEKMIEFWKLNQLNYEDFKELDLEMKENPIMKKNSKEIYKENAQVIIEEISQKVQNDELNIEFRIYISTKVMNKITKEKLNIYTDLMKTTKAVIKTILENWILEAELTFNEEINNIIENFGKRELNS